MCVWFSVCVVLDQRAHNAASSTHTNAQCVSETNRTRCLFRFNTTLSHCHSRCLVTQTYKHNFRSRMFFFYFSPNASTHTYSKPMCPIPMRESVTHTESDRECVSESGNDGGKKTPKTHVLTKGSLSLSLAIVWLIHLFTPLSVLTVGRSRLCRESEVIAFTTAANAREQERFRSQTHTHTNALT